MKKNELINKTLAGLMIAAMTAGVCPTTAFAVTGGQVAKDGVYEKEVTVSDGNESFDEYKVSVALTVENGKFSSIKVTPIGDYDEGNNTYLDRAENGYSNPKKNINFVGYKSLVEQDATEDTINSWNVDAKSSATYSSKAIKSALVSEINDAPSATVEVNTSNLEAAIAKAKGLTAADYTADSWAKLQTALTAADEALTAKESQDAVNTAANNLTAAIGDLKKKPEEVKVDTEKLDAAIAKADALKDKETDYTENSWKTMQAELATAKAALEAKESQDAVDAAAASLQASIDALKAATPAESENVDTAALEKVIATAKGLNKNDYTATTWTTMQAALTNAEKALEAKESQTSVDEAAKTLQAAIDGLKKASATTTTTDDKKNNNNSSNKNNNNSNTNNNKNNTTNSSTNKNSTTSPKTGDPVSVMGLLGAAISSVGLGGLGLKLRKRSRKQK